LLYQDPIDELVAGFKYRQQLYLGPSLADICIDDINTGTAGVQLLLPVPMRPRALRERGFNQAAELARQFSRRLDIPWAGDRLFKTGGSRHQQTLNRAQRRRNVRATFACRNAVPPAVALIDDVVTTGATVEEASRVLKRAGAERVEAWAVARTPRA
jgi:ComF family protein